MSYVLLQLIETVHILYIFLPILVVLLPIKYTKKYFKYIFLGSILTPIGWGLNNNKCILSDVAISFDEATTENISRKKLKWFYKPIMDILELNWESNKDLDYVVYLHWGFNFFILWIHLFYIAKCKVI
jgi:hypothetical protein